MRTQITATARMHQVAGLLALCMLLVTPEKMSAQTRDTPHCCTVVRIDVGRGIVTARETATGYTFRVEVKKKKHLAALKVGDKVWADFAARKVRLEVAGSQLCCNILDSPPPSPPPPDLPASPIPYPHSRS